MRGADYQKSGTQPQIRGICWPSTCRDPWRAADSAASAFEAGGFSWVFFAIPSLILVDTIPLLFIPSLSCVRLLSPQSTRSFPSFYLLVRREYPSQWPKSSLNTCRIEVSRNLIARSDSRTHT